MKTNALSNNQYAVTQIPGFDSYERTRFSETTLALLCDFTAGDVKRPLRRVEADWQEVFQGVLRNGLVGLAYDYLAHCEASDYPPPQFRDAVERANRVTALRMALMYRHVVKLLARINELDIDYMVVKGPAVAHSLYPDPAIRVFNDLDMVIQERDWTKMYHLLTELGFAQEENLPEPPPKFAPQVVPYESKYFNQEIGLRVEVHYDDFLNAGLMSRDVKGFWQRAVLLDVKGVPIKVMSLEDQLIHLCAHMHYHGYTRLIWFSDIAFIVRDHARELNWKQLIQTVEAEEAQVSTYYSLYFLNRLLGISAPEGVLQAICPDSFRRWLHERYMPEDKILSLEPIWRPDLSFYFVPLFKRLIPDLLVMGRRGEKLDSLIHLLRPPREWLRFYYRLTDPRWITIHYLLHPLRIVFTYLREMVRLLLLIAEAWS